MCVQIVEEDRAEMIRMEYMLAAFTNAQTGAAQPASSPAAASPLPVVPVGFGGAAAMKGLGGPVRGLVLARVHMSVCVRHWVCVRACRFVCLSVSVLKQTVWVCVHACVGLCVGLYMRMSGFVCGFVRACVGLCVRMCV